MYRCCDDQRIECNRTGAKQADWVAEKTTKARASLSPLRPRHVQKERNVQAHFPRTFSRNLLTYGDGKILLEFSHVHPPPLVQLRGRWSRRLKRLVSHCSVAIIYWKPALVILTRVTQIGRPSATHISLR